MRSACWATSVRITTFFAPTGPHGRAAVVRETLFLFAGSSEVYAVGPTGIAWRPSGSWQAADGYRPTAGTSCWPHPAPDGSVFCRTGGGARPAAKSWRSPGSATPPLDRTERHSSRPSASAGPTPAFERVTEALERGPVVPSPAVAGWSWCRLGAGASPFPAVLCLIRIACVIVDLESSPQLAVTDTALVVQGKTPRFPWGNAGARPAQRSFTKPFPPPGKGFVMFPWYNFQRASPGPCRLLRHRRRRPHRARRTRPQDRCRRAGAAPGRGRSRS